MWEICVILLLLLKLTFEKKNYNNFSISTRTGKKISPGNCEKNIYIREKLNFCNNYKV